MRTPAPLSRLLGFRSLRRAVWTSLAAVATASVLAPAGDAAFPGSNGRIAFLSVRANGGLELYTVDPDGSGLRQLTQHSPAVYETPAWSPRGRVLAIVGEIHNDVLLVNLDSRRPRPLRRQLTAHSRIAWSPDARRIAYSAATGDGDIWTAHVDGSARRRLTRGSAYDFAPAWSPNGRWIAFARLERREEIDVVRADGSARHLVGYGTDPAWSPSGRSLAYLVRPSRGHTKLVVSPMDRRAPRMVVADPDCDVGPPAWSRTGTIAFSVRCETSFRLDAVDASGRNRRTLVQDFDGEAISWSPDAKRFAYVTMGALKIAVVGGSSASVFPFTPGGEGPPAWSPDGRRIAVGLSGDYAPTSPELFAADVASPAWSPDGRYLVGVEGEGASWVVLVDLQTKEETTIYTDEGIGYPTLGDPAWSPDGRFIAFSVFDSGRIAFYDVAREHFIDLGKEIAGQNPAWSPDGSRLAFDSRTDENQERSSSVYTARRNGNDVRRIATNASDPAWSPDGKQIVFVRSIGPNRELYVMRTDGTQQRRLTVNPGLDIAPDWQPLPPQSHN